MVQYNDKSKMRWDMLIMILTFWNCYKIPLSVSFDEAFDTIFTEIINVTVDVFFLLDIIVNFRTVVIMESTGEEFSHP
jgi:hypothetical protein